MVTAALAPVILRRTNPASAAAATLTTPMAVAPCAGRVIAVRYVPTTILTGADTNSRTLTLFNRAQAGAGTVSMASRAFVAGQNIAANVAGPITLSATLLNLDVVKGDVLDFESLSVGIGLADPGGLVEIVIQPSLG